MAGRYGPSRGSEISSDECLLWLCWVGFQGLWFALRMGCLEGFDACNVVFNGRVWSNSSHLRLAKGSDVRPAASILDQIRQRTKNLSAKAGGLTMFAVEKTPDKFASQLLQTYLLSSVTSSGCDPSFLVRNPSLALPCNVKSLTSKQNKVRKDATMPIKVKICLTSSVCLLRTRQRVLIISYVSMTESYQLLKITWELIAKLCKCRYRI